MFALGWCLHRGRGVSGGDECTGVSHHVRDAFVSSCAGEHAAGVFFGSEKASTFVPGIVRNWMADRGCRFQQKDIDRREDNVRDNRWAAQGRSEVQSEHHRGRQSRHGRGERETQEQREKVLEREFAKDEKERVIE